jgi:hypothetical protein
VQRGELAVQSLHSSATYSPPTRSTRLNTKTPTNSPPLSSTKLLVEKKTPP